MRNCIVPSAYDRLAQAMSISRWMRACSSAARRGKSVERDPATDLVGKVAMDIEVPPSFPEKYRSSLVRAAEQCAVKKHLEHPPSFDVKTVVK